MSKIVKLVTTIRNNWKKSVLGVAAVSYGLVYAKNSYFDSQYMRKCCDEAALYSEEILPVERKPRKITIFLNPAANRRKARAHFEKYCTPLLNLAGILVNVISTESEGQVRVFLETFDEDTDAIIIAGGDGTLSEAITGLLRKSESSPDGKNYIVGVLPLGRTNTIAKSLFAANSSDTEYIDLITKAAMAIIHEVTKPIDVIKIQLLEYEDDAPPKPIYSINGIQWGAYRDANARQDKYWYFNDLRSYVTYIFTGLKGEKEISWKCKADLSYTLPCSGCSKCYKTINYDFAPKFASRWWHTFLPGSHRSQPAIDYTKVVNEECGERRHQQVSAVELALTTTNVYPHCPHKPKPYIEISVGPESIGYTDFVAEGWSRVNGNEPTGNIKLAAREIELRPLVDKTEESIERWMSVDLEEYEVKPVHLTLLPKRVRMFCALENVETN